MVSVSLVDVNMKLFKKYNIISGKLLEVDSAVINNKNKRHT